MQSQLNTDALVELSDFSSTLLRADADRSVSKTNQQYRELEGHRNLSSLIAGIRDEGSAIPASQKKIRKPSGRSSVTEFARRARQTVIQQEKLQARSAQASITDQAASLSRSNTAKQQSVQDTQPHQVKPEAVAAQNPASSRQQFMLLMVISFFVSLAFVVFQLYNQSNELRESMSSYEKQIQAITSTTQKSTEMATQYLSMSDELHDLRQTVQGIKSDHTETAISPKLAEIENVKQEVSVMHTSIIQAQRELSEMKAALGQVNVKPQRKHVASNRSSNKMTSVTTASNAKTATNNKGWAVVLASFTNAAGAEKAAAGFRQKGLDATIEKGVVKTGSVYRLIKSGYETRVDALGFIKQVKAKYGVSGAWVFPR